MKKTAIVFTALAVALSCATMDTGKQKEYGERLRAENSLMKKRLVLLERENGVLKQENLQYKKDLQQLGARFEKLEADLASLNEKYRTDIALRDAQNRNLAQKNAILEKESSEKIKELTAVNKEMETRLSAEIRSLNEQMARQKEAFNKEREALKQESAKKEFELSTEIGALKKNLAGRETEVAALKTLQSEAAVKIQEAARLAGEAKKAKDAADAEIAALKEKNADAARKLQKLSDELKAREAELRQMEKKLGELKDVKAPVDQGGKK